MADTNDSERVGEKVRIFRRGAVWYANYQFEGRQRRESLGTTNKKAALAKAHAIDRRLADGESPRAFKPAAVAEAVDRYLAWLRAEGRARKTMEKYGRVLAALKALCGELGVHSLAHLSLAVVDEYRSRRARSPTRGGRTCAEGTVYDETVVIRQLVNFSLRRGLLREDPLAALQLKRPKRPPQPCFTGEQLELIHAAARRPHAATFLILAETGLRFGELRWLTWEDVDFVSNVLLVRAKDGWRPKTGDERAVPMSGRLRSLLGSLPRKGRWVLTAGPHPGKPDGRQIDGRRALVALGRVLGPLGLRGRLHTFRHAFVSKALSRGVPEAVVRSWVGHVDAKILRHYTHIHSGVSQDAMRRMD